MRRRTCSSATRVFANWLYGFTPPEPGTVVLVHRRVAIVPARLGWIFGGVLGVLLSARSTTRARSASRSPSCWPRSASPAWCTPRATSRASRSAPDAPSRCSPASRRSFACILDGAFDRPAILARHLRSALAAGGRHPANGVAEAVLAAPGDASGWLPLGRVMLETRFPLGLFRAWSYIEPDARCLVYPRPERSPLPPFTGQAPPA